MTFCSPATTSLLLLFLQLGGRGTVPSLGMSLLSLECGRKLMLIFTFYGRQFIPSNVRVFQRKERKKFFSTLDFCNVMTATFLAAGWCDAHELCVFLHACDIMCSAIGYATAEPAYQLLDNASHSTSSRKKKKVDH